MDFVERFGPPRELPVIEEEFDVSFHKAHVSRLLHCLHWTPQVPVLRAMQRDRRRNLEWRKIVWPQLKAKAQRERKTLVLHGRIGLLSAAGRRASLCAARRTSDHQGVANSRPFVGDGRHHSRSQVLQSGAARVAQRRAWHRIPQTPYATPWPPPAGDMGWLADPSPRSGPQRIPREQGRLQHSCGATSALCLDLNPIEEAWQHLKHVEMRNLVCLDLEELHLQLHLAIARLRQKPKLIPSFFAGAGLNL